MRMCGCIKAHIIAVYIVSLYGRHNIYSSQTAAGRRYRCLSPFPLVTQRHCIDLCIHQHHVKFLAFHLQSGPRSYPGTGPAGLHWAGQRSLRGMPSTAATGS